MRRLAPLFALLLLVLISAPIAAQTSPTIDNGVVTFMAPGPSPLGNFIFAGPNMTRFSGRLNEGYVYPDCSPCEAGQEVRIRSHHSGVGIRPGEVITGNGTEPYWFWGILEVESPLFTLPYRFSRLPFKIVVPITMHGTFEVHRTNPFLVPNLIYQMPMNLQGTATLTLRTFVLGNSGRPWYSRVALTYDFTGPNQTEKNNPPGFSKTRSMLRNWMEAVH